MTKAIALLSGGLDSTLAIKAVLEQGIEVEAINFVTPFCTCSPKSGTCLISKTVADNLGIMLEVKNVSREYLEIIKYPRFGYGKNMNPCIDCRIFMFKKAAERMKTSGASFIITGEVLGERPMSQRRDAMNIIERESNLKGLILRPLSAKLLEPSIPEKEGLVDREKLLDIQGRSRKPQLKLAEEWDITDYACPAGGCLLTDKGFARRLKDLMNENINFTLNDIHLLKIGRHLRLSDKVKAVIGRNESENKKLMTFVEEGDSIIEKNALTGPLTVLKGEISDEIKLLAGSITASYGKGNDLDSIEMSMKKIPGDVKELFLVKPYIQEEITKFFI
jgi:tRNA U34 2-thiouridine synthase MnmA/TrmU